MARCIPIPWRRNRRIVMDLELENPNHRVFTTPVATATATATATVSSSQQPPNPALRSKEILWAEGIRGLAALGVVSSHLCLCFAKFLFAPCCAPGTSSSNNNTNPSPHPFQLPILRLVAAGDACVALFLVLTGFTASQKPLSHARRGKPEQAYAGAAVSAFRRLPRLFLPATLATVVSWAVCNLGGYEVAHQGDGWWLMALTPNRSFGRWWQVFVDVWWAVWVAWMPYGVDPYDQPQWALQFFVEAGFMVGLAVLGTARLRPFWRGVVLAGWALWSARLSVAIRDPFVGYCTLFGMVIAEINMAIAERKLHTRLGSKIFGGVFILLGLIGMSYPADDRESMRWSREMTMLGEYVLPFNNDKMKPWVSLGCLLFFFGITWSSMAQRVLSIAPLVWLGKISFPLYLLHGTFIRSLFAWVLFAGQTKKVPSTFDPNVKKYPLPSNGWIFFSVLCLFIPLLICCQLWMSYLEPQFDRLTLALERIMLGTAGKGSDRGWVARIKSVVQAMVVVARNGPPPPWSSKSSVSDLESELGALVQDDAEFYTPTRLFAMDDIVQATPSPYRDSSDSGEDDSEQRTSQEGKFAKEEKNRG